MFFILSGPFVYEIYTQRLNNVLNPHKTCKKMGTPMRIAKFANSWTLKDKNGIFSHLRHQIYL